MTNWAALSARLPPHSSAALSAFRRRHADLLRSVADLKQTLSQSEPHLASYPSVPPHILSSAKESLAKFTPSTLNINSILSSINAIEQSSVQSAKSAVDSVNNELEDLKSLLNDINSARPLDQLTVDDVAAAMPELDKTVAKMVKRGQWRVPGYYEK